MKTLATWDGACDVHGEGTGGGDGMRGDGVGIRNLSCLPCDKIVSKYTQSHVDGRGAGRERDGGVVS